MIEIGLGHYLSLGAIIFFLGTIGIFLNRKNIWRDPALRIILLILICYFLVFGIGVSNFGSGIRHRSKFIFGLILLAGPFLPKFFLSKKNKLM